MLGGRYTAWMPWQEGMGIAGLRAAYLTMLREGERDETFLPTYHDAADKLSNMIVQVGLTLISYGLWDRISGAAGLGSNAISPNPDWTAGKAVRYDAGKRLRLEAYKPTSGETSEPSGTAWDRLVLGGGEAWHGPGSQGAGPGAPTDQARASLAP